MNFPGGWSVCCGCVECFRVYGTLRSMSIGYRSSLSPSHIQRPAHYRSASSTGRGLRGWRSGSEAILSARPSQRAESTIERGSSSGLDQARCQITKQSGAADLPQRSSEIDPERFFGNYLGDHLEHPSLSAWLGSGPGLNGPGRRRLSRRGAVLAPGRVRYSTYRTIHNVLCLCRS